MPRVLIIDDEIEICNMLKELFTLMTACKVEVCSTQSCWLNKINKTKFDLICLDYSMPDMLGTDIIAYIRSTDNPNRKTNFIMITGHEKEAMMELGSDKNIAIVSKPIVVDQLMGVVKKLLLTNDKGIQLH